MELYVKSNLTRAVTNGLGLAVVNIVLMLVFGFMVMDSEANTNSLFGAVLLSVLIPYFLVSKTRNMGRTERLLKLGTGLILYLVLVLVRISQWGTEVFFGSGASGLILCILVTLGLLYGGNRIFKMTRKSS